MENEYYTPTIEEFHVGFEYEYMKTYNPIDHKWYKAIVDKCQVGLDFSDSSVYRVKYLDKEDIESLGFEYRKDELVERVGSGKLYLKPYYKLTTWRNGLEVRIVRKPDTKYQIIFEGQIKNKSELKKILKQLRIDE